MAQEASPTVKGRKPISQSDIGREIIYLPRHAKGDRSHTSAERGVVKSITGAGVFVDYGSGVGKLTMQEDLVWPDYECDHEYIPTNAKWKSNNNMRCCHCGHEIN